MTTYLHPKDLENARLVGYLGQTIKSAIGILQSANDKDDPEVTRRIIKAAIDTLTDGRKQLDHRSALAID